MRREEREILELMARGLTQKQIAAQLGLPYNTVTARLRRLKQRLGVPTTWQLMYRVGYTHGRQSAGKGPQTHHDPARAGS